MNDAISDYVLGLSNELSLPIIMNLLIEVDDSFKRQKGIGVGPYLNDP